jgi:outer membrane protein insertion porin family
VKPVRINVMVREVQPFQLRYGASYDTEGGLGGLLDLSNHNSLGGARVVGVAGRYDKHLHDARIYISQPALSYLPFKTTGNVYLQENLNPPTEITRAFTARRKGTSIQQEVELRDAYVWNWGYRYERATTLAPVGGVVTGETHTVSPLTTTITRETRDEPLDAARGAFLSQAFSFSPGWLGADLAYWKYLGQYFHYFPLRPPQRKPLTNEVLRPRFVFATGARFGLARGFSGGPVPRSERFFAGGSSTLRGFALDSVGPIGPDDVPTGGSALFILNNELRVPLVSIVDGVLFTDIGNVFNRISNFSLTDLRQAGGVGLRVRTPWFLLRGDYGVVFDPRPGERRSRFYFSIGQAF